MGKEASSSSIVPSNLRNESYYMATDHETWNGSMLQKHMLPDLTGQNLHQRMGSEVLFSSLQYYIITVFQNLKASYLLNDPNSPNLPPLGEKKSSNLRMKNLTFSKVKAKQKVLSRPFCDNGRHLFYYAFTVF